MRRQLDNRRRGETVAGELGEPVLSALRPPLKWAGGKRWLLPRIRPLWEPYRERRFVELFCGGLAITLGIQPRHALLNDINPHAINFYRWLQRGLTISFEMSNERAPYYSARQRFNDLILDHGVSSSEAAGLFYYLNRTGYNGLCRFNQSGEFNVPFGRHKQINYVSDFTGYRVVCGEWLFSAGDFAALALAPTDFVYADPPYDVEFTQYAKESFGWDDQVRLARWLVRHPGPVVLSNQRTDRIVELYRELGFALTFVSAPRMINRTGDRTPALEVIATRNLAAG
jgi:DNA adenine methylase